MPPAMFAIWRELSNEETWLRLKWQNYRALYSNPETVTILNESAGSFFGMCQRVFFDDAISALCRITDRAETFGRENVSLKRLMGELDNTNHSCLISNADNALSDIEQKVAKIRIYRNKRIGHNDLQTSTNANDNPITGISRQDVTDTIDAIRDFLDLFEIHFDQTSTAKIVTGAWDGAETLVNYLKRANELREKDNYKFVMGES